MKKLADVIIEKRLLFLAVISLVSLFFLYKIKDLEVYTKFADLLPQGHEYIKVHNKIQIPIRWCQYHDHGSSGERRRHLQSHHPSKD